MRASPASRIRPSSGIVSQCPHNLIIVQATTFYREHMTTSKDSPIHFLGWDDHFPWRIFQFQRLNVSLKLEMSDFLWLDSMLELCEQCSVDWNLNNTRLNNLSFAAALTIFLKSHSGQCRLQKWRIICFIVCTKKGGFQPHWSWNLSRWNKVYLQVFNKGGKLTSKIIEM